MMAQHTNILLAAGTNEMEIVEFYIDEVLDGERTYRGSYGINVAKVVEIIRQPEVTSVPMAPAGMMGTFISRGKVIPLIDISARLGKRKPAEEVNPLAIVTEFNRTTTAFAVTGVNQIHRLAWGQIDSVGRALGSFSNSITGVVKIEDRNVLILDMEKLLTDINPASAMKGDVETSAVAAERQYKALVVDDSASIRNIIASMLEKAGFVVRKAGDGEEAWQLLQELRDRSVNEGCPIRSYLDIVISDIEMPQADGYSLCQAIKRDPVCRGLPVILFSSLISEKQLHKGRAVGADDQISKPETSNLAQRASELIDQYRIKEDDR
jgi:two-component system chemotaxis response regulator CheV